MNFDVETINKNLVNNEKWILDNVLFMHVAGSHLYGTNGPSSDIDIRGVVIPPKEYWVGAYKFEQKEMKSVDGADVVIYDFRKWLKLAYDCNPNIIESVFVEKDSPNVIFWGNWWSHVRQTVIDHLLNQRAYDAFMGYSTAQYKKLVTKYSNKTGRRYISDQHGFDTKFCMHAFRLTYEGTELLTKKNITFPRPEREELLAIRHGQKYKQHEMDKALKGIEIAQTGLRKAKENSVLPIKGDHNVYNRLLIETFDRIK